ncbi:unnamed protein product [Amoebophrya sp. A25]|nr:unnamed protein product [Amoebophrya sp. A25]|eukprot:GSA25T00000751001.1
MVLLVSSSCSSASAASLRPRASGRRRGGLPSRRIVSATYLASSCVQLLFSAPDVVKASRFEASTVLGAGKKKCIGQELMKNVLSVFEVESIEGTNVAVTVLEEQVPLFSEGKKSQIKTAITAQRDATHWLCIVNENASGPTEVNIAVRSGPAAKDYSQIAKREHLEPVQLDLQKIGDELDFYTENLRRMRATEDSLRELNDTTASRVVLFCVLNLALMILMGGWQIVNLKNFFRSKKII